ncbi:MAG: hypothetical protein AAGC93_17275 [Cyanobacteria bacterium P01_F01_bin.53]
MIKPLFPLPISRFRRPIGLYLGLGLLCWGGIEWANSLTSRGLVNAQGNEPSLAPSLLEQLRQGILHPAPNHSTENSSTENNSTEASPANTPTNLIEIDTEAANILRQATDQATQAELLTQTAASAADWDGVMLQWLSAIALAQSIPPESPSRIVAQRQLRSYVQRLQETQQQTEQTSPSSGLPSLGSDLFDAQLTGYLSYVATVGTPDILIVGSSRALQGIDPMVMQQQLSQQGYKDVNVFNFSVNGATAQVVNFVLSELLPQPLPPVIVWGDGSRAFNDGRRDRTWESLVASPGYQTVNQGTLPASLFLENLSTQAMANDRASERTSDDVSDRERVGRERVIEADNVKTEVIAASVTANSPTSEILANLDALGFSAVGDRFSPQTYYQQFPQVRGRYDGAYSPFTLNGSQTGALGQLADFSKRQNSQLIFVNLPLSGSYLDADRLYFEGQFQQFLQTQSSAHDFEVIDMLTQWQNQPALFADPSHINQDGAAVIATQLAQSPTLRAALYQPQQPDQEQQSVDKQPTNQEQP